MLSPLRLSLWGQPRAHLIEEGILHVLENQGHSTRTAGLIYVGHSWKTRKQQSNPVHSGEKALISTLTETRTLATDTAPKSLGTTTLHTPPMQEVVRI